MEKLRIAVAGAGSIGQAHLGVINGSDDLSIACIIDPSDDAIKISKQYHVPIYRSLDELFGSDEEIDGIVLATPNSLHVSQALECIEKGLPVLVEKPLATTYEEGRLLTQAVRENNGIVLVGHHRVHSPIMQKAHQIIAEGRLGRLVSIMGSAQFYKPANYFKEGEWRTKKGGGPALLNLIHEIQNLRILCGDVCAVQAVSSNEVRQFEVEDTMAILLQFKNGVLGTFILSDTAASTASWEQASKENSSYFHDKKENCYWVSGTEGSLAIPTMSLKYFAKTETKSWFSSMVFEDVDCLREDPLALQIAHFGAVIRGDVEPLVTAKDGLENMRVLDAIVEATQTGCTVQLTTQS